MEMKLLLLQLQVSGSVIFILILRQGMKKLPKVYSYGLWLLVFARLLCPIALESRISFMPSAEQSSVWVEQLWSDSMHKEETYGVDNNFQIWDQKDTEANLKEKNNTDINMYPAAGGADRRKKVSGPITGETDEIQLSGFQNNDMIAARIILFSIWIMGVAAILGKNVMALAEMNSRIRGARRLENADLYFYTDRSGNYLSKKIYISRKITIPFTLGFVRPRIYLPAALTETEREYIICHESVHIRRKDYIVKNVAFLLLAVNWFNPFVWIAFHYMESDMEMSCDEKVVKLMGSGIRRRYSQSLLDFAVERGQMAVTPLTFGESNVKKRVKNILMLKNAKKWSAIAGMITFIAVGTALFTTRADGAGENPPEGSASDDLKIPDSEEENKGRTEDGQKQSEREEKTDSQNRSDRPDNESRNPGKVYRTEEVMINSTEDPEKILVEFCDDGLFREGPEGYTCLYSCSVSPNVKACSRDGILYFTMGTDKTEEDMVDRICMVDVRSGEIDSENLCIEGNPVNASDIRMLNIERGYVVIYKEGEDISVPLVNTGSSFLTGHSWNGKGISELNEEEQDAYGIDVRERLLNNPGLLLDLSNRTLNETYAIIDMDGDGKAEKITLSEDPDESQHSIYNTYQLQAGESRLTGYSFNMENSILAFGINGNKILLALCVDHGVDLETIFFSYENKELREIGRFYDDIRYCVIEDSVITGCWTIYDVLMPMNLEVRYRINEEGMLEQESQDVYELIYACEGKLLVSLPVHDSPDDSEIHYIDPQMVLFTKIDKTLQWIYLEGENGEEGWFKMDGDKGSRVSELNMNNTEVFELYYAG